MCVCVQWQLLSNSAVRSTRMYYWLQEAFPRDASICHCRAYAFPSHVTYSCPVQSRMGWEEVMWNRSELHGMERSHMEREWMGRSRRTGVSCMEWEEVMWNRVSCMEWEEVMWNRSKLYGMGRSHVEQSGMGRSYVEQE